MIKLNVLLIKYTSIYLYIIIIPFKIFGKFILLNGYIVEDGQKTCY